MTGDAAPDATAAPLIVTEESLAYVGVTVKGTPRDTTLGTTP